MKFYYVKYAKLLELCFWYFFVLLLMTRLPPVGAPDVTYPSLGPDQILCRSLLSFLSRIIPPSGYDVK